MTFNIKLKKSAEKELKQIKGSILIKIDETILKLGQNPKPVGSLKIKGEGNLFRIRCGDYRIIYEFKSIEKLIEVIAIINRKNAYKKNK